MSSPSELASGAAATTAEDSTNSSAANNNNDNGNSNNNNDNGNNNSALAGQKRGLEAAHDAGNDNEDRDEEGSGSDSDSDDEGAEGDDFGGDKGGNSNISKIGPPIVLPDGGRSILEAEMDPKLREMVEYMLRYSFSKTLNNNTHWTGLVFHSFPHVSLYMMTSPPEKITMKAILKAISPIVGQHLVAINRKKEELLSFEAIIVLAFMKTDRCKALNLTMEDFLEKYPQFKSADVAEDEKNRLFEFCNCVRIVQCLIPAKNNKEHILDLVSRLTEGFAVRRVTGTGMTIETRNRYDIIHKEGGITPCQRPERRVDKTLRMLELQAMPKKKRGRPLSSRVEEPVVVPSVMHSMMPQMLPKIESENDRLLLLLQASLGATAVPTPAGPILVPPGLALVPGPGGLLALPPALQASLLQAQANGTLPIGLGLNPK